MTAADFLLHLRNLGVKMWLDGGQLKLSAPKNVVTPELREELKARKSELIQFLQQSGGADHAGDPIPRASRDGDLPVSFGQDRLWILYQLGEDSSAYNMPVTLRLRGRIDTEALAWSARQLVERHEVLRTSFRSEGDSAVQVVHEQVAGGLEVLDASGHEDPEAEARRLATEHATRTFDITRAPLWRFVLIRIGEADHVLCVTLSHIIGDGWSYEVLLRELRELYDARIAGTERELPELPIQYADYAIWQQEWYPGEAERLMGYWRPRLDGVPILELPTDRPRPSVQTFRGDKCDFALPKALSDALLAVGQKEGCTLFMTVLAAFKVLLARYARSEDVVIGTAIANRDRAETQGLIGMFMNMLVMRSDFSGDPSFAECLRRVREAALGAYQHQEMPFEQLVAELRPVRDPSRNPLFQVVFVLDEDAPSASFEGVTSEPFELEHETSKFDITLAMRETGDGLAGTLEFNVALFDRATIERMARHFELLVAGLVADPALAIWQHPLLGGDERERLIGRRERTDYPRDRCAHELVQEWATKTPDALAVQLGDEKLTYAELNARANRIAHFLRARGVEADVLVGVLMERTPAMVCALLGVMKAGGAYVPLDPANPAARQQAMIEDAQMPVLLTQESLLADLPEVAAEVVCLDRDAAEIDAHDDADPELASKVDDLAYVIFTSGSTGVPKGVQVEHRGLLNLVFWHRNAYSIEPSDRATQIAGLAFDASVWELWPYLTAGASMHLPDEETRSEPAQLLRWLDEQKITVSFLPTPLAEAMLAEDVPSEMALRAMLVGGDKLNQAPRAGLPFEVVNHYGPTESTVVATCTPVPPGGEGPPPIGVAIDNVDVYLLDAHLQPVPVGIPGELFVGGESLARGYHRRPELTEERFVASPFVGGERLYRTGDLARYRADGQIEFIGRIDHQVKVRGFRIELGEIEQVLTEHAVVKECAVVAQVRPRTGEKQLAAFVVLQPGPIEKKTQELREHLKGRLPDYMVPATVVSIDQLPLTPNGKIDRVALAARDSDSQDRDGFVAPSGAAEVAIAEIWSDVLGVDKVGREDNFFDLGGHSALVVQLRRKLQKQFDTELSMAEVFQYPTVASMAEHLGGEQRDHSFQHLQDRVVRRKAAVAEHLGKEKAMIHLAVIGMSGRYPKSRNLDEFWANIRDGVECISFFSREESIESGVDPELVKNKDYVAARAILDDIDMWDASFFGVNPREAEAWDPQQRLFLECAYEALENAGYDPFHTDVPVGVFGGCQPNSYAERNIAKHREMSGVDEALFDHRFLPTRVSYKLNLKGPGVFVYSACSTSLVAVVQACQSLQDFRCDVALAGGTAVGVPQKIGHVYRKGEIYSPDGHCRPYDAKGGGTLSGEGVGVVVLKRLEDAVRDGDPIRAVIRGAAINNDGSNKVGFTAPSVDGQAVVVADALAQAEINPETITYVEGHGTATQLGDPIEVGALTRAFRSQTDKKQYCGIGSVKGNIAHLDTGAGIAGFIKTVLAIENAQMPPSLYFEKGNPECDFENSPFYVNAKLQDWTASPRRAGVSSFGFGGTNAHVILEQAPAREGAGDGSGHHLLTISAKTKTALEEMSSNLVEHLKADGGQSIADIAYTTNLSRSSLPHRRAVICTDVDAAIAGLTGQAPRSVFVGMQDSDSPPVVFMFPGQGAQYANMGRELYDSEPVFKAEVDKCCDLLQPHLGLDLRELLFPAEGKDEEAAEKLGQTWLTQPAVFVIEYALARLWMHRGVKPSGMVGHSVGEFVAACLAETFSLEDALRLVAARGKMMQDLPEGDMLGVPLPEDEVEPLLGADLQLAAVNGPSSCVVSGPKDAVAALEKRLTEQGLACRMLHTSHAFHSAMMDPIVEPFTKLVAEVKPQAAKIACLSTVTGTWIEPEEWASAEYWARNLRQPVRFSDAAHEMLDGNRVLLEVGPGQTLSTLVRQHTAEAAGKSVIASMRHPRESTSDVPFLMGALGRLWISGVAIDWARCHGEGRLRVPLPTYPFQRRRYWIEPHPDNVFVPPTDDAKESAPKAAPAAAAPVVDDSKKSDVGDWFYIPSWTRSRAPVPNGQAVVPAEGECWVVFADTVGVAAALTAKLPAGSNVVSVNAGDAFQKNGDNDFTIRPRERDDYVALLKAIKASKRTPTRVLHMWGILGADQDAISTKNLGSRLGAGFYSSMFLVQGLAEQCPTDEVRIDFIVDKLFDVIGGEAMHPDRAAMLGPCRVVPQEHENYQCRMIDIDLGNNGSDRAVDQLLAECLTRSDDMVVAYRGQHRWLQGYEASHLGEPSQQPEVREGGVYVITGGLGGIGLVLADYLAERAKAKLVLVGRSGLPPRSKWDWWVKKHGASDKVSTRIRKVKELEAKGAEVLVASADVSSLDSMRDAIARARVRFGAVHGVIHAAGLSTGGMVALRGADAAAEVLDPKISGTLVLMELLGEDQLDFFVVCSSVSAILGGIGGADYCGANSFLDALVHSDMTADLPMMCVNWDAWTEVGMAAETEVPDELKEARQEDLKHGILNDEGQLVFERMLNERPRQVAVFTRDLASKMVEAQDWQGYAAEEDDEEEFTPQAAASGGGSLHPRPDLPQEYVAPTSDVQKAIAEVAQELLGIDKVGINDNFFDLGFDSLLAHRMIGRLQGPLNTGVPLRVILEAPTVGEIAKFVEDVANGLEESEVTKP